MSFIYSHGPSQIAMRNSLLIKGVQVRVIYLLLYHHWLAGECIPYKICKIQKFKQKKQITGTNGALAVSSRDREFWHSHRLSPTSMKVSLLIKRCVGSRWEKIKVIYLPWYCPDERMYPDAHWRTHDYALESIWALCSNI